MAETLRERTRRAVRAELAEAAQELFLEHGYESTTVEQIASAAGLSRRSFFRYFDSKEALVLDKFEASTDAMVEAFERRPVDEPLWTSMRAVFETPVAYQDDPHLRRRAAALQAIVQDNPGLRGAQLGGFATLQDRLVEAQISRLPDGAGRRLEVAAVISAAFACLQTAMAEAPGDAGTSFADRLDRAMSAVRPLRGAADPTR